jgi:hypothetical protein
VTLKTGFHNARARVIFLTAPGGDISAKNGVTLGGAEIQDDATWRGTWSSLLPAEGDETFLLKLPAATAALVEFRAR